MIGTGVGALTGLLATQHPLAVGLGSAAALLLLCGIDRALDPPNAIDLAAWGTENGLTGQELGAAVNHEVGRAEQSQRSFESFMEFAVPAALGGVVAGFASLGGPAVATAAATAWGAGFGALAGHDTGERKFRAEYERSGEYRQEQVEKVRQAREEAARRNAERLELERPVRELEQRVEALQRELPPSRGIDYGLKLHALQSAQVSLEWERQRLSYFTRMEDRDSGW
ncbi:MAG: hypothetical protein HY319_05740 [Armatimonadetes bacterium]|nr:hypothetical protein [Armatimonadota bacterium]